MSDRVVVSTNGNKSKKNNGGSVQSTSIFNYLSDHKLFITFGISLIVCFAIIFLILYKKNYPPEDKIVNQQLQICTDMEKQIKTFENTNRKLNQQNNEFAQRIKFLTQEQMKHRDAINGINTLVNSMMEPDPRIIREQSIKDYVYQKSNEKEKNVSPPTSKEKSDVDEKKENDEDNSNESSGDNEDNEDNEEIDINLDEILNAVN